MKIKTWLLISYLIVMILPIVSGYGLYVLINEYYQHKNVEEYFKKRVELQKLEGILDDPNLYTVGTSYEELDKLTGAHTEINLYLKEGYLLYSSNPIKNPHGTFLNLKNLYKNLYDFKEDYYSYTYREPVLEGTSIIGFYEVKLARDEWINGVKNRTGLITVLFIVIFISIFALVVILVNRKLINPLQLLMKQMRAFAKNQETSPILITNDEIGELATSFDEMRQQIITANQRLTDEQSEKEYMIASISHDLKTPLTSIRSYAEALSAAASKDVEQINQYSQVVIEKSDYMKQMLDDLLMHTLLQSINYEMELVEVEGDEFFEMLISDYEPLCMEKGISLETYCAVGGTYQLNPKQMLRVMDNLSSNAIRHTPLNGHILLAAFNSKQVPPSLFKFVNPLITKQDGVYLIVQNSGDGIDPEELSKVFQPLYQIDTARTKKRNSGTGLGLSITKRIIGKHGGLVEMASEKQIGTCVICWLPQTKETIKFESN
jgi:signal transduction histidine kinase